MFLNNRTFKKWICSRTDSCKLWLYLDAGIIILHYITAGIYNSEIEGAYLTTSIKEIVAEMSDSLLKQIFSRRECAMCCIMTPAALASQWKTVLMFSITATLPLHQDRSKIFWQVSVWWCTLQVRDITQAEESLAEMPVMPKAMKKNLYASTKRLVKVKGMSWLNIESPEWLETQNMTCLLTYNKNPTSSLTLMILFCFITQRMQGLVFDIQVICHYTKVHIKTFNFKVIFFYSEK